MTPSSEKIPENTPMHGRLIILHIQKTCISLFFNKYLNSLTTLQHLNDYLNARTFQHVTQKSIGKLEDKTPQSIADSSAKFLLYF